MAQLGHESMEHYTNSICVPMYAFVNYMHGEDMDNPDSIGFFFEYSYVCGVLGYHQILMTGRMHDAIGWQLSRGCYGDWTREAKDAASDASRLG